MEDTKRQSLVAALLKYNAAAPRYTSYPPANLFAPATPASPVKALWEASNALSPRNLSFYFHVPFCAKRCHFCGCTSEIAGGSEAVARYFEALYREMEIQLPWLDASRPLTQVHFGGGTPNAVPPAWLDGCLRRLKERFSFAKDAEIAVECNPAHLSLPRLQELASLGFNRISLGIQDFDEAVLRTVGRDPSALPVPGLVSLCRELGFVGINLDLMYGLPGQSVESFLKSVELTIAASPDRVALFSYAHVPWVKENQHHLDGLAMPSPALKVEMFLRAREYFQAAGYMWVGMDHFVKPSDSLGQAALSGRLHRNFQGYCDRAQTGQVYAFGCSAISQLGNAFIQNVHSSTAYSDRLLAGEPVSVRCHVLSPSEQVLGDAIERLMCDGELKASAELQEASQGGWERLRALEGSGLLVCLGEDRVRATDLGQLVIRYLAMQLDPLMVNHQQGFSQTL